jgi:hypothetical protein
MSETSISLKTRVLWGQARGTLCQREEASFSDVTFCYTQLRRER